MGAKNHLKNLKKLDSAYIMQPHNIKPWEHHFSKKADKWPALFRIQIKSDFQTKQLNGT